MLRKLFITFSLIVLITGCQPSMQEQLLGEWESSMFVDAKKFAEFSDDPMPPGMQVELTYSGDFVFHHGNKYNESGEMVMRINNNGQEVALRFAIRDAGTWEVHDSILVQTTTDSKITALDDVSRNMLAQSPEFAEAFKPVKGESYSSEILRSGDDFIDMKMKEEPYLEVTLRRKK
jgi:hypothetical protein